MVQYQVVHRSRDQDGTQSGSGAEVRRHLHGLPEEITVLGHRFSGGQSNADGDR